MSWSKGRATFKAVQPSSSYGVLRTLVHLANYFELERPHNIGRYGVNRP